MLHQIYRRRRGKISIFSDWYLLLFMYDLCIAHLLFYFLRMLKYNHLWTLSVIVVLRMWNILIALVQSLISLQGTFLGEDETISLLHPEGKKSCEILLFMHIFWFLSFFLKYNGCGGGIDLYKWVMNYCPSKEPKQIRSHGSIREKCTSKCKREVTKFMMNISIRFELPRIQKYIL